MKKSLKSILLCLLSGIIALMASCSLNDILPSDCSVSTKGLEYELRQYETSEYKIKEGYAVVGIGSAKGTEIVIPSKYKGKPVFSIASRAFIECETIKSVRISKNVKYIGEGAFLACSSLESVSFDKKSDLLYIEEGGFGDCYSLKSIEIPDSVTYIGQVAFGACFSLTSIRIPSSVSSLDPSVFFKCNSLTSITYNGTMKQWKEITNSQTFNGGETNYTVYCTDGNLDKNGNQV